MESNQQKEKGIKLEKINPILQKLTGKTTYLLWENEEEKKLVLKYIYEYCEKNINDKEKIYELSVWSGIQYTKIEEYTKYYALEYLGYSSEEYSKRILEYGKIRNQQKAEKRDLYYPRIYRNLLNATSLEEIIKIISEPGVKISTLRSVFRYYVDVYHNGDNKIKEILKSKIKMYTDYISEKNRKELENKKTKEIEEKIPKAINIVTAFINYDENLTIDYFCQKNNLDERIFEEYIAIIKEYRKDLYNKYLTKINDMKKQRYAIIINQIKYIIEKIKNGVEEYEINRPFDLIDYYQITGVSLEDMLKNAKEILPPNEFNIIKNLLPKILVVLNTIQV